MAKVVIGVRVEEEMVKLIDDVAERSGQSRTDVIINALDRGLYDEQSLLKVAESRVLREAMHYLKKMGLLDAMAKVLNAELDQRRVGIVERARSRSKEKKKGVRASEADVKGLPA